MSQSTIFFVLFSPENWDHRRGICRVRSKSKLAVYSYYTVKTMICTSPFLMNLSVAIVCLGCLWTHQKMREPNSSVVSEPSGSSGELYHRFLRHTKVVPRRRCIGQIFVFWWHDMSLQESHEQCVQWIVRFIHSQHSPKRIAFLYDCLAMAVETSLLPPRYTTLINTHSCFSSISCTQKSTCLFIMCL